MTSTPDLDLTLFGASGFVGRLVAEHLAQHAPAGLRVGLAGRSAARVDAVRTSLGAAAREWQICEVDSGDHAGLARLAQRSRVVATTVGPYVHRGLELVLACARAGADYLDLTGEVLFVRKSIEDAHDLARTTGARIVHACGFDSVPSDLAAHLLYRQAGRDGAGALRQTTLFVRSMRGGLSGGTIDSMRQQVRLLRQEPHLRQILADPEALSGQIRGAPDQQDITRVFQERTTGEWAAPFVMGPFNTRIVRRSHALLRAGYVGAGSPGSATAGYGEEFRYREVMSIGPTWADRLRAAALSAGVGVLGAAISTPGISALLDAALPKPGQGPSAAERAAGRFRMQTHTRTADGSHYLATVAAQGDPGYAATAVMFGQSALALAVEGDRCRSEGGVLTPAVAMGDVLLDRLYDQGFTLEVKRV